MHHMMTTDASPSDVGQSCRKASLLPGYVKADPRNLPKVDILMIIEYYQCLRHPAMKHVKLKRSAGENYGDDAIGYVQLMRKDGLCEVAARITPEHRVATKPYCVVAVINEQAAEIVSVKCHDCIAAEGPCKHAAAFLGWLERRSEEKPVTSTTSYWKKARLSNAGAETKKTTLTSMRTEVRKKSAVAPNVGDEFFKEVLSLPSKHGLIYDHFGNKPQQEHIGIDHLLQTFLKEHTGAPTSEQFLQFCKNKMTPDVCKQIERQTVPQARSPLWHAMRFARVTASKAYSVATASLHSNTSLVMSVIGATKIRDTAAMKRGRELEPQVLKELTKHVGCIEPSGIILDGDLPVIGASPDGITGDGLAVIEVKCPSNEKNLKRYINKDGTVAAKHLAQVQMLMHMTRKSMALFCVADPGFETNNHIQIVKVNYDPTYCTILLKKCVSFWENTVFIELCRSYESQS